MKNKIYIYIASALLITISLQGECIPNQYRESNISQLEHALKEMHKLDLNGSEKILDIGSGDGKLSSYIVEKYIPNGQLVGIDKSNEMVSFALSQNHNSNINYQCVDAAEYSVPNEYDAVVSFWTLHWVSDYKKVVDNIAESLKPGGKALLCHGIGTPLLLTIAENILNNTKWNAYRENASLLKYPSLSQVAHIIEESGLIIESLEVKTNGIWMQSEDIIKNWLSLPMFDFIPPTLRKEYCQEILQIFTLDYPANEKGEIFRCSPVIVMVLKKRCA